MEVLQETGRKVALKGQAQIRGALAGLYGAAPLHRGELFDHIMMATVVTLDPDGLHAAARSTQLGMVGANGKFAQWELGVYENRFVKRDEWQVAALRYFPRVNTDYDLAGRWTFGRHGLSMRHSFREPP
jgi:hypothetical protein